MLRKIILAALVAVAAPTVAQAQSACASIVYGAVLTAAQWNFCFQQKQDVLGFTPLNKNGDVMNGTLRMNAPLITVAPSTSASGFNLPIGAPPSAPNNGDVWTTNSGLSYRINGSTYTILKAVSGPPLSTDSALASWNGAGGDTLQNNPTVTLSGAGVLNGITSIKSLNGVSVQGNITGTAPAAGFIGQVISSMSISTALTTATPAAITTIVLTPGTWDITGGCSFTNVGSPTATDLWTSIGTASATMNSLPGYSARLNGTSFANPSIILNGFPRQVAVAGPTAYYINAQASFTGGTSLSATCELRANRTS